MAGIKFYILEGRTPKIVDMKTWGRWFADMRNRRVAADRIGKVAVSTVFLGMDHDFSGQGPPLLFETLVIGGPMDGDCKRTAFYKEAQRAHAELVAKVRAEYAVKEKK